MDDEIAGRFCERRNEQNRKGTMPAVFRARGDAKSSQQKNPTQVAIWAGSRESGEYITFSLLQKYRREICERYNKAMVA